MNYRNISTFAQGIVTNLARGKADISSLLIGENIRVHHGDARPRPGCTYIDEQLLNTGEIVCLYEYTREYFSAIDQITKIDSNYIFNIGSKIYAYDPDVSDIVWQLNEGYEGTGAEFWMAQYGDKAYMSDGTGSLFWYDGVRYYKVGIDPPPVPQDSGVLELTPEMDNPDFHAGEIRRYKLRYVRYYPDEYVASPFSGMFEVMAVEGKGLNISKIEASDDPQVTHIELYATRIVGSNVEVAVEPFYMLERLPNVDQNYGDIISNISLESELNTDGEAVHPQEDTSVLWIHPPYGLKHLLAYRSRIYGVPKDNPSIVRYSDLGVPESWPADNWIEVDKDDGDIITGFAGKGSSLYLFKNYGVYELTGDPDANASFEVIAGGDRVPNQTEAGVGCTAPRTISAYGSDLIAFYNSLYGAFMIRGGIITPMTPQTPILGHPGASCGALYMGLDGELTYILTPPSGETSVIHLASGAIVKDTNINAKCYCIDSLGRLLAGTPDGYINHIYDEDAVTDNNIEILCKLRTAWINMRDGDYWCSVRKVLIQSDNLRGPATLTLFNQDNSEFSVAFDAQDRGTGVDMFGRLISLQIQWLYGIIESLTMQFKRVRVR